MLTARILTIATGFCLAACATTQTPEQRIVNDAASALGGRERLLAISSLEIEGDGLQYNLGQDLTPGARNQTFAISGFRRVIDLQGRRQKTELTRTPNFAYFQGPAPQRQVQGIDGEVGYNISATGTVSRVGTQVTRDRRIDFYHHPFTLVSAALAQGAMLSNARDGAERSVEVQTPDGSRLTLVTDGGGVPIRIESRGYNANLGDVRNTTTFANYVKNADISVPTVVTTKVDDFTTAEYKFSKQTVGVDTSELTVPADVAAKPAPDTPPANVIAEVIAPGIWFLAGQTHHSVLVEFADHLTLIEAPQSEARTLAVIAKARELRPDKPLTTVVTTHHHFDHTAGIRGAASQGLNIVTHAGNVDFFKEMLKRPHTIQAETLAKAPREVTVEGVASEKVMKDSAMDMAVYHVADNPHSSTMLMAYFPQHKVLVEVDAFSPTSAVHPYAANLLENITKRKLQVDRIVPLHGGIAKMAELTKAAAGVTATR